jgi:ABC-type dipeptide/oligopeptide/nickel transport system permease subunit
VSSGLARSAVRTSGAVLGLLVLVAIFADLLACNAPLVMSRGDEITILPILSTPQRVRDKSACDIAAELGPTDWAIWPPVRSDGISRSPAGAPRACPGSHLLGQDAEGHDLLARFIHGTRSMVLCTGMTLAVALLAGLLLGALAGTGARLADWVLSRSVELTGMLPTVVLLGLVHAIRGGPSVEGFVLVVGLLRAVQIARLLRGEFLHVGGQPFVTAAVALGAAPGRVLLHHMLPHALRPVLVCTAFGAASVVALEAALSFLGLALPAGVPTWGALLSQVGRGAGLAVAALPGLGIAATTAALYVLAEAAEGALDPRRKRDAPVRSAPSAGRRTASA